MHHLVRVGALASVGRFRSVDGVRFDRGARVVVRTTRGLEVGEVLSHDEPGESDGDLLRRMTDSDELLAERLQRNRQAAYEACVDRLLEIDPTAVLLDVEHLFDGRGLYFYFLGETGRAVEALTAELATAYDAEARFGQFAETLDEGCGPDCGTPDAAGGGGCSSCGSCAVKAACGVK